MTTLSRYLSKVISLILVIIVISCEENKPPAVEILYPQDSTLFDWEDVVSCTIRCSDEDGMIKNLEIWVDLGFIVDLAFEPDQNGPIYAREAVLNEQLGEHTITAIATDGKNSTSEDQIRVFVEHIQIDHREDYIGEWQFNGTRRIWNANNDPMSVTVTVTYLGSVSYGSKENSLAINYYEGWTDQVFLDEEGNVTFYDKGYNFACEFYSTDSLFIAMENTSLGAGTALTLIGVKH